ncbi:hypothetical protein L596_011250 [Steinernema carpocapsae]|uniref:Ribosome biogenesis protein NOP53 n=1 Tax=Steinernema carpocapsae TaxID=34508 RepID=A0A4U5NU43_STECR|nr:hypothetical protein L596_011250 [Steinernema carpocapsae]
MGVPAGTSISRPAKKRLAKSKKKHWRKGTDISEVESYLHDKAHDAALGGVLGERQNDELFTIDKLPSTEKAAKKETMKHRALLQRRAARAKQLVKVEEPEPSKRAIKKATIQSKIQSSKNAPVKAPKKIAATPGEYDLWDADLTPKIALEDKEATEHYLTQTKKKQPKMPGSMRYVTSLLPKVQVAKGGASYNPTREEYVDYVTEFAEEEKKMQAEEKKLADRTRLKPGEKYITAKEKLAEVMQGLESGDEVEEQEASEDAESAAAKRKQKIKTEKQRRTAKFEKLKLLLEKEEKARKQLDNDVFRAPKLSKDVKKRLALIDLNAKLRKKRKAIKKLTTRQKLGRGEFEKYDEPFLLEQELSDSLRKMQAQNGTAVLKERFSSMQLRNMMPVPGEKPKQVLKKRLREKIVEKRSVREVTRGSKVF